MWIDLRRKQKDTEPKVPVRGHAADYAYLPAFLPALPVPVPAREAAFPALHIAEAVREPAAEAVRAAAVDAAETAPLVPEPAAAGAPGVQLPAKVTALLFAQAVWDIVQGNARLIQANAQETVPECALEAVAAQAVCHYPLSK